MKRILSFALAILLAVGFCCNVHAAMPSDSDIVPLWENIDTFSCGITLNGTAGTATAVILGLSGTTKITGTLTVYKQTDDGWAFVDKTTGTSSSTALSLKVSFTAESGAYYKAECSVTVTRNGAAESETKTAYKTCP